MKQKKITKWAQGISTGILVTALSLMAGTVNTQAEPVKEGENCMIPLTKEVKLDMVWIKPGTFTMGSPEDELGRYDDETQHKVTLTQGYWLGKYEITQAQYEAVTGTNPSNWKGTDLPVEKVSWNDAMEFCKKLTEIEKAAGRLPEGYEYTLPTEAQWEYACRARTTSSLNNGKNVSSAEVSEKGVCDNLDEVGWYWMNGGMKNWNGGNDPAICTHPGGQKKPNNWGLYDMHGNVCEWCLDWVGDYQTSSVTDLKGTTGKYRVARGGGWGYSPRDCRSAHRGWYVPDARSLNVGFRLALTPVK